MPDLVVADVVDDNRTWYTPGTPAFERIEQNYADVLARSDVVLANCEPVAESMETFTARVHVVPNACELPGELPIGARPAELRDVRGPIIGYAGNLSGRIDLELLRQLARARRDWTFVLLGSTHLDQSALALGSEPNVRLIGTKRYEEAQNIISHFDVALIPHLDNEMSRSMNPLKAYVYCALGVPIVSTPGGQPRRAGRIHHGRQRQGRVPDCHRSVAAQRQAHARPFYPRTSLLGASRRRRPRSH